LGGGLFLFLLALCAPACDIPLLYPPLAASCFIGAACPYLRVARPKQVIIGHFVSAVGGLAGIALAEALVSAPTLLVALKLGLAVAFAAALMQIFDADHPPAAATAAIPAILPLPVDAWLLPLHMAWGATLIVLLTLLWNRIWFEYPAPEPECPTRWLGLCLERSEVLSLAVCLAGFALMAFKPLSAGAYYLGLACLLLGSLGLMLQHFLGAAVGREGREGKEAGG
jgi:hypothetical protein